MDHRIPENIHIASIYMFSKHGMKRATNHHT